MIVDNSRRRPGSSNRPQEPCFCAAVLANQDCRNSEQPRQSAHIRFVKALTALKRNKERLGCDVIRRVNPRPSRGIPVHGRRMTVVHLSEDRGLIPRTSDDLAITGHNMYCPIAVFKFTAHPWRERIFITHGNYTRGSEINSNSA